MKKINLELLIERYAYARARFAYACGLRAGIEGTGRFEKAPQQVVQECADDVAAAENKLYKHLYNRKEN